MNQRDIVFPFHHMLTWPGDGLQYGETYGQYQHVSACNVNGKGRYSFPLAPPAPKLIRKQQLLSNCELKRLLWNAVAMESSRTVQRP